MYIYMYIHVYIHVHLYILIYTLNVNLLETNYRDGPTGHKNNYYMYSTYSNYMYMYTMYMYMWFIQ